MKIKSWIIYPIISIILFVAAYLAYPLFESLVDVLLNHIPITVTDMKTPFRIQLLFALTFAFIPLLVALTGFLFQTKGKHTQYIYISMLLSMTIFGGIRILNIQQFYTEKQAQIGDHIQLQYPMENLQIVSFMFVGSMIGCIVGAIFLKRAVKKVK